MRKVLIIGGEGYIGTALSTFLNSKHVNVVATQRHDPSLNNHLDLSQPLENKTLLSRDYDAVVVLAAMTNILACEQNPQLAKQINVTNTLELLTYFSGRNIHSIFMSTNQVFSCTQPFVDWQCEFAPCSFYGELKAEVERTVQQRRLNCSIVRPSKVIGVKFPLFEHWYQKLTNNEVIECFNDHFIAPLKLSTLCEVIAELVHQPVNTLVQLSGNQDISYFELATLFTNHFGLKHSNVHAITALSKGVKPLFYGSLEPFVGSNIAFLNKLQPISPLSVIEEFHRGICA